MKRSPLAGFSMGKEASEGLCLGLKLGAARVKAGGKLSYSLAIANRGSKARTLVLFRDTEGTYRTRLLISAAGKKPVARGLVVPQAMTSSGFTISIELEPKVAHFSDGWVKLPANLRGELTLIPVWGGTEAVADEVRGAPVTVLAE